MHPTFWRAAWLFVLISGTIFQEGINPVGACSVTGGDALYIDNSAVCISCAASSINDCDNVFCIGDISCEYAGFYNVKYVECSSTGGTANAACRGVNFGTSSALCVRCVKDGCDSRVAGYTGDCALAPSATPSQSPSSVPSSSSAPSLFPSAAPSRYPSSVPSLSPSSAPSLLPSSAPSISPTGSSAPSSSPSFRPSQTPLANKVDIASSWETIFPLLASGALVVGMLACLLL